MSEWLQCCHSMPNPSPGRKHVWSRVGCRVRHAIQSVDLGCLEGVLIRRSNPASCILTGSGPLVRKAAKRMTGWVPVPHHVSRDRRVRGECDRRIKCPGSRAHVRRRAASLRSTPPDLLEPVSVFDGSWRSSPDRFARRPFRLRGCGRR